MIEIREVVTKTDIKKFVDFPTKLYKKCKNYVHPIRMDEINLFDKDKNVSYDDCEIIYFLALSEGAVVGRIAGIIQKLYNEKTGEKRARFSRFDTINDVKVAKALLKAVENWAKDKGMNIVHEPMGFNDLDREGMLIEGFDEIATFEEQYNFDYYPRLMEKCGYKKEIDWLEYKVFAPKKVDERIERLAEVVLKRYDLRIVNEKSKKKLIDRYKDGIFEVIDEAYSPLYGVVPLTQKLREQLTAQFELFLSLKFFIVVVDKNDRVVAFGFAFPSLSRAMNKSRGKFLPFGIFRMIHAIKYPKIVDLALIGIRPEFQGKGVNAVIMRFLMQQMINEKIEYCETNLNLEDNIKIQQQWESFEHVQHKKRRSYIKILV